ncbi:uncharacterized protein N7458_003550 [Penicillium daleae]|uniref:Uncharacterized protein n=1 Tax=Penicillium daleae TaxID=63821 RepID=A0AAD6CFA9_9EURO|nr:uncharacterized protein N7458_003550 [Penicillium daleae]KAJ5461998.1 hypothetical protein N7458_003550 [Penicillium daleae]
MESDVDHQYELAPWVKKILKAHNPNHSLVRGGTLSTRSGHPLSPVAKRKRTGLAKSPTPTPAPVSHPPAKKSTVVTPFETG